MKHPDDNLIRKALSFRKIAVVGLSSDPSRASHGVTRYMMSQGYEISCVNPNETEVLGMKAHASLRDLADPIEIVDVFRRSDAVPEIVDQAIEKRAKVLWLQEGVTHPEAEERARKAGLIVISDRCILKEHHRLI